MPSTLNDLITQTSFIAKFSVISRWMVAEETPVTTHHKFTILDTDFDATSTDASMWGGF